MSINKVSWVSSSYPEYENYEKRLKTFFDRFWPISTYQNETTMAKAGFFYPGFGDIVTCAFCGINLHKWLPHDDPIIEHKNTIEIANSSVYLKNQGIKKAIKYTIFL